MEMEEIDYAGSFVPVYRKGVKRLSGLSGTDDVRVIVALATN